MVTKMDVFSRRHNLHRPSIDLIYEDVPDGVRRGLFYFLSTWISIDRHGTWMIIQGEMFKAPRVEVFFKFEPQPTGARNKIEELLVNCEWYTFWDVCELLSAYFDTDESWKHQYPRLNKSAFEERMNQIFADNSVGYELKEGKIERIGAPYIDEVVTQARQVLRNPAYAGPDEQFEKAISFLNQRPNPDTANCLGDAVGAVEGLARIVTGKEKDTLSDILKKDTRFKSGIPGALLEMMQKLYAYRGDAEGVAHGQTSTDKTPAVEEAELVLGISASCMIYLAKKFGEES